MPYIFYKDYKADDLGSFINIGSTEYVVSILRDNDGKLTESASEKALRLKKGIAKYNMQLLDQMITL